MLPMYTSLRELEQGACPVSTAANDKCSASLTVSFIVPEHRKARSLGQALASKSVCEDLDALGLELSYQGHLLLLYSGRIARLEPLLATGITIQVQALEVPARPRAEHRGHRIARGRG